MDTRDIMKHGTFRIVILRRNRREHIVRCDGSGTMLLKTLCNRAYDAVDRTSSKPIREQPSEAVCENCRNKLAILQYGSLRRSENHPDELVVHYTERFRPYCGQDCPGKVVQEFSKVTCKKCRAMVFAKHSN